MIYFFRLYEVIEDTSVSSQIIMHGKLRHHMHYCSIDMCPCVRIAESVDETKKYRKIKAKQDEEEHNMMIQTKMNENEASFANISPSTSEIPQDLHAESRATTHQIAPLNEIQAFKSKKSAIGQFTATQGLTKRNSMKFKSTLTKNTT